MFNLKRKSLIISTLALSLATGALVTGCSTSQNADNQQTNIQQESAQKNVDLAQLGLDIENSGLLTFNASSVPFEDFAPFYEIADKIEDAYASSAMINLQFQHVGIAKTKDAKAVTEALENYLKSDSVRPYADGYGHEDNVNSVQNAKIGTEGDYVYFIAAPNSDKIEELVLNNLK